MLVRELKGNDDEEAKSPCCDGREIVRLQRLFCGKRKGQTNNNERRRRYIQEKAKGYEKEERLEMSAVFLNGKFSVRLFVCVFCYYVCVCAVFLIFVCCLRGLCPVCASP